MCFDLVSRRTLPPSETDSRNSTCIGHCVWSTWLQPWTSRFCGWSSGTHFQLCLFVYYYNTTISIAVGSAYIDYQECVAWNGTYESWSLKITGMPSWAYSGGPNEFEIFGNLNINGKDISGASTPWTTSLNQFVSGKLLTGFRESIANQSGSIPGGVIRHIGSRQICSQGSLPA